MLSGLSKLGEGHSCFGGGRGTRHPARHSQLAVSAQSIEHLHTTLSMRVLGRCDGHAALEAQSQAVSSHLQVRCCQLLFVKADREPETLKDHF